MKKRPRDAFLAKLFALSAKICTFAANLKSQMILMLLLFVLMLFALCAIGEMRRSGELHMTGCGEGEGFALNANQCTVDILLHCAIGRGVRLNGRCAFRRKDLHSDAH